MPYSLVTETYDHVADISLEHAARLTQTNPRNLRSIMNGYGYKPVGDLFLIRNL